MSEIEASIAALGDEDLLDLHDIFLEAPENALASISLAEIGRRLLKT